MKLADVEKFAQTYFFIAAPVVATTYFAGEHNPKVLGVLAAAAVLAPLRRAMNPKDPAYGIVAAVDDVVETAAAKVDPTKKV